MIQRIILYRSYLSGQACHIANAIRRKTSRHDIRHGLKDKEDPEFFTDAEPSTVADIEKKIEDSKKKLIWRPVPERSIYAQAIGERFLSPVRMNNVLENFRSLFRQDSFEDKIEAWQFSATNMDQRFIPDRHRILGNDLAAAHFIVARGGEVKFTKSSEWIKKDDTDAYDLPDKYNPTYLLQAIKCDNMTLVYVGLENIRRLHHLSYLSFRNVKTFDDWCLDRVCGNQFEKLEVLDLSGTSVTANGLVAVPKLSVLKAIILDTVDRSIEFNLACSLLEEARPDIRILSSTDVHNSTQMAKKLDT